MQRLIINTIAVLGLSLAGLSGTAAGQGKNIDLVYRVYVGGLETGEVELKIEHAEESYRVMSEIRSLGLVDALIKFRSNAISEGRVVNNIVSPARHEAQNMWRGDPRTVSMAYDKQGPATVRVMPLPEDDDRIPVTETQRAATFDALSAALVTSLSAMANTDRCNATVPVFDGRRRYNIHVRGEEAQAIEGPVYSGPSYRCEMKIERIAGHSSSPWMPRREDESGEIWFARLTETWTPVPVRFEADIGMGSVVIHLIHASGTDIDARYGRTKVAKNQND
jgi:hypothetical protein